MDAQQPATVLVADDSADRPCPGPPGARGASATPSSRPRTASRRSRSPAIPRWPSTSCCSTSRCPCSTASRRSRRSRRTARRRTCRSSSSPAATESEDVVDALRLGAHDYLRKPPETAELLARVGAAVQVTALRAELRRRTEELDRMSRTDHLTGLYNRRHLDERAARACSASSRRHSFPLHRPARRRRPLQGRQRPLRPRRRRRGPCRRWPTRSPARVRTEDLVGRWGGEEFLVLAPLTDLDGAAVLGERLREHGRASATAGSDVAVTVSIGAAVVQEPGAATERCPARGRQAALRRQGRGPRPVRVAPVG